MPKIKKETFSQRLAEIRKAKGLSQYDLADITGIKQRMIAHYETRIKELPHDKIVLLAKALDVSIDELMGHKPIKNKEVINRRILKKAKMLEELSPDNQKTVIKFIDALHKTSKVKSK